jgi:hypothetical protein
MEEFEDALAKFAASNAKARYCSTLLSRVKLLEDKVEVIEGWQLLVAQMTRDGEVAAAPDDVSSWFDVKAFLEDWKQREWLREWAKTRKQK